MTDTPITTAAEALEAAVDNWQAWLDDLPLPEGFSPGIEDLQEFLRALAARIDSPVVVVKPQDGPERIWAWAWEVNRNMGQWEAGQSIVGEGVEYIRADLAQPAAQVQAEAVAGAYLAVLREISGWDLASTAVEALTPADATAALARIKAEARKDALREALDLLPPASAYRHAIAALIDKETAHD